MDGVEERGQLVDVVQRAGECRGEIEAKSVDVHLGDPVAQRVGDQLQRERPPWVEGVAAAGVVDVARRVILRRAVVRAVVDAAEAQNRAVGAALGGVVVDDVEDDLDARAVQRAHHRLELAHHRGGVAAPGGVRGVRREETDRVVAPVVGHPAALQVGLAHELVDRQQLDGGDAERAQVLDDRRVGEPRVRPAQVLGDVGVQCREALDVQLVDDGGVPGHVRPGVVTPRERVVGQHRARHAGGGVRTRAGIDARIVDEIALDGARVRIDEQLGRIVEQPAGRVERTVDAEAVTLAGADAGQVAVPYVIRAVAQRHPRLGAGLVEQADRDAGGRRGPQGEVRALAVPLRAERERRPRPGGRQPGCLHLRNRNGRPGPPTPSKFMAVPQ